MSQSEYVVMLSDGRRFLVVQDHHVPNLLNVFKWIAIDLECGRQYLATPHENFGDFEIRGLGRSIPVAGRHS